MSPGGRRDLPTRPTGSLSLLMGCHDSCLRRQDNPAATQCPLHGCEGSSLCPDILLWAPSPLDRGSLSPVGGPCARPQGGTSSVCQQLGTSAVELDTSAGMAVCDPGQLTSPLCASVSPLYLRALTAPVAFSGGVVTGFQSLAREQLSAKGSQFKVKAGQVDDVWRTARPPGTPAAGPPLGPTHIRL